MQKRIPIKNHQQEIQLVMRRQMIALITFFILLFLLISRLAYLQIYKNDLYTTQSTKNWLDLVPVEPTRGLIYDRNGKLLAENISVFSLDIVPAQVIELDKTLVALGKIIPLNESDLSQFNKQLKQHRRFDEIPLKVRLTDDEVARFAENQYRFPGVLVKARLMRHYPHNEQFSHVVGYVGRINMEELSEIDAINYSASHYIGKSGIEKYYEEDLHGKVGYQEVENDASGKPVRVLNQIKGTPGKNIYLTIDSDLQVAAIKALDKHRGAIVAIQPGTGQVLAMVSNPQFDPNLFVLGISHKDYQALKKSKDKPLFNRALNGLYPLASTIKPYVALKILDTNLLKAEDTIYCRGVFQLKNNSHIYHDHRHSGHGQVNLSRAIAASCDPYFYEMGSKMGIRRIDDILKQFGFGEVTGIDLNDEIPGIVASPEWKKETKGVRWYEGDTVISAIGQGFMQATPLQIASAAATLAMRGERYMPYLLLGVAKDKTDITLAKDKTPYIADAPVPLAPVVLNNKDHWEVVIKAMQDVLSSRGTAHNFGSHHGYTIAGKTGTAQLFSKKVRSSEEDDQKNLPEKLRDHNLFIAFAPVDKPKIAVAIITENSHVALDVAHSLFEFYLGKKPDLSRTAIKKSSVPQTPLMTNSRVGIPPPVISTAKKTVLNNTKILHPLLHSLVDGVPQYA